MRRVPPLTPPVARTTNPLRCASPDQCGKTCGLFVKSPLVLPKISLLSDQSRPLFLPFPPPAADSSAFPPSPARIHKQFPPFPCSLPRSAESNCQFVSRRPQVGAEFRRAFTTFLATQRPKTTTSKHIHAKYIQHDTYFRAFLSLAHKKVVHLHWIVVRLWPELVRGTVRLGHSTAPLCRWKEEWLFIFAPSTSRCSNTADAEHGEPA